MDVLDKNIFSYDDLDSTRIKIKSEMVAHRLYYDSDYANYLNKVLSCSSLSSSDDGDVGANGDGENEEDDEGQTDTHFKMFLENIEADGASYVLKRHGKPDLKFEGMDEDGGFYVNVVDQVELSSEQRRRRSPGNNLDVRSQNISAVEIDPDYNMFFDQCQLEEDTLLLVANGKRLKYGEDDNQSHSHSQVYVLDHAPDCIESNYAPAFNFYAHMEDDDLQCLGSCNPPENPLFRKAVMDILRNPFNYKEYRRLRKDVKQRKLIKRHVDMRSGNTSFQQSTMGKSYLDHYADLKKQLDAFKNDIPKRLNILRGFFFYLKRMADDGKFKPWLDDSCLAIIPRTG